MMAGKRARIDANIQARADARDAYIKVLEAECDRYRQALVEIAEADPVDMALDPGWAARIAAGALNQKEVDEGAYQRLRLGAIECLLGLMPDDGDADDNGRTVYLAFVLSGDFSKESITTAVQQLEEVQPGTIERAADWACDIKGQEQRDFLLNLLTLASDSKDDGSLLR
jgi:hypothetical protein